MASNATGPSSATTSSSTDWIVAIVLTVFSGTGTIVGTLMMKQAYKILEQSESQRKFFGIPVNWHWFAGFMLVVVFPTPLDFIALGLASASLVFPIGVSTSVLMGQVLAPKFFFKTERLGRREWIGTFLIVSGAICVAAFGNKESKSYSAAKIKSLWGSSSFLALFLPLTILFAIALLMFHVNDQPCNTDTKPAKSRIEIKPVVVFLSVAFIPSYIGGVQTICFKAFSEITNNSDVAEWLDVTPYLYIVAVVILAASQLKYMNMGAEQFQATKYFPAYNAGIMLTVSLFGAVFYEEYEALHPVGFPVGMLLILFGIACLGKDPTDSAAVAAVAGDVDTENKELSSKIMATREEGEEEVDTQIRIARAKLQEKFGRKKLSKRDSLKMLKARGPSPTIKKVEESFSTTQSTVELPWSVKRLSVLQQLQKEYTKGPVTTSATHTVETIVSTAGAAAAAATHTAASVDAQIKIARAKLQEKFGRKKLSHRDSVKMLKARGPAEVE